MLINWINVTVYAEQWPKLFVLLPQAERAINEVIERDNITGTASVPNQYIQPHLQQVSSAGSKSAIMKSQKELVYSSKAKIQAVYGLAHLQDKNYKIAAEKFMQVYEIW
jgi:hypothetical protein